MSNNLVPHLLCFKHSRYSGNIGFGLGLACSSHAKISTSAKSFTEKIKLKCEVPLATTL